MRIFDLSAYMPRDDTVGPKEEATLAVSTDGWSTARLEAFRQIRGELDIEAGEGGVTVSGNWRTEVGDSYEDVFRAARGLDLSEPGGPSPERTAQILGGFSPQQLVVYESIRARMGFYDERGDNRFSVDSTNNRIQDRNFKTMGRVQREGYKDERARGKFREEDRNHDRGDDNHMHIVRDNYAQPSD